MLVRRLCRLFRKILMCGRFPCDKLDCTWSGAHRAKCEARTVAAWDKDKRLKYYGDVRSRRGDNAAHRLVDDVNAIRRDSRVESD